MLQGDSLLAAITGNLKIGAATGKDNIATNMGSMFKTMARASIFAQLSEEDPTFEMIDSNSDIQLEAGSEGIIITYDYNGNPQFVYDPSTPTLSTSLTSPSLTTASTSTAPKRSLNNRTGVMYETKRAKLALPPVINFYKGSPAAGLSTVNVKMGAVNTNTP